MATVPSIDLLLAGKRFSVPVAAVHRLSANVLAPMAEVESGEIILDAAGLSAPAISAVEELLRAMEEGGHAGDSMRPWLGQGDALVEVYHFANKYGMNHVMEHINLEYIRTQLAAKRATAQELLMRFKWHKAVVDTLIEELQERVDEDTAAVDVLQLFKAHALVLVLSNYTVEVERKDGKVVDSHPRADGCVVINWAALDAAGLDKAELPAWIGDADDDRGDAAEYTVMEPPVRFDPLLLRPNVLEEWGTAGTGPSFGHLSQAELDRYMKYHLFEPRGTTSVCNVALMVDGLTCAELYLQQPPCVQLLSVDDDVVLDDEDMRDDVLELCVEGGSKAGKAYKYRRGPLCPLVDRVAVHGFIS